MSSSLDPIDDTDPTSRPTLPDSLLPPDEGELAAPQAPDSEQTPQSQQDDPCELLGHVAESAEQGGLSHATQPG